MPDVDVTIRRAQGLNDYLACVQLQKDVWQYTEAEDLAAQPMLMISDRFGGSVLVALDSSGRHIGFAFAMPGWHANKRLFWWSHMTAVLPEYRNQEVGLALKLKQRAEALTAGIDLIEWTFDPLQSLNAHFNLCKLGVIVHEYEENVYGYTSSPLHRGLPTDRFVATWDLDSERVRKRVDATEPYVILRDLDRLARINMQCNSPDLSLEDGPLLLEIPHNLDELRRNDLDRAKLWQTAVRTACLHYFNAGFVVTDFVRIQEPRPQSVYVLERVERKPI
jgi:predicted GNAT superfamily acetyltransferase